MCGISGFIELTSRGLGRATAEKMIRSLDHRGPDNISTVEVRPNIFFSHSRLSIVDESEAGNQPMKSENDWITFNGEIFNYESLKKKYCSDVAFKSVTDSEVLLELLRKKNLTILEELDGFFCFAYYSHPFVYLVRDFFGKKPLYYHIDKNGLVFASEIKAFREFPIILKRNMNMVSEIMRYRFSTSLSPFENLEMLDAGSYLKFNVDDGNVEKVRYYDLSDKINIDKIEYYTRQKESTVLEEIESRLLDAVNKRCLSSVKLATICSGGLDSSLISAMAKKHEVNDHLHVDVIGNSEKYFAELMATYLGCSSHSVTFDQSKFFSLLEETIEHYEYPIVHPNNVGILAVADLAKTHGYKIILGGEGADELFGGYSHHSKFLRFQRIKRITNMLFLNGTIEKIGRLSKNTAVIREYTNSVRDLSDLSLIEDYERILKKYRNCPNCEYMAFLFCDLNTYLPPLLLRGDKLFMARGIELRLPFMDKALIEMVVNLPMKYRIEKSSLKKIARNYLPGEVINRKKNGFALNFPSIRTNSNLGYLTEEQKFIMKSLDILYSKFE
jgi:asparagine synthase (glutamine-hydrolysing)